MQTDTITENKLTNTWLVSDLHFTHRNIISYAKRPFKNLQEMEYVIISNWNSTVQKDDIIYMLGDFVAFAKEKKTVLEYLGKLNGNIIPIRGNHDMKNPEWDYCRIIETTHKGKKYRFLLVHDPDSLERLTVKEDYDWVIHGHHHNHYERNANSETGYPLINTITKQINVSIELIKYKPISLLTLIKMIERKTQKKA